MTFLEAAIEVLRDETEPLHFSEISKRAVARKLLSHVGRDPDSAMRTCLTSALRGDPPEAVLRRVKPGVYEIKPGAKLPDPPAAPAPVKKSPVTKRASTKKTASKKTASKKTASKKTASKKTASKKTASKNAGAKDAPVAAAEDVPALTFEAPSGSGLSGPTDVALVMANAMSRLAGERPELRDELDAMHASSPGTSAASSAASTGSGPSGSSPGGSFEPRVERKGERGRLREDRNHEPEERGNKRRRRRRKKGGRRVEWTGSPGEVLADPNATLLKHSVEILSQAGARSLHVRQIAEQLASRDVHGGDISELERAATAAMLSEICRLGDAARFVARGEARYELRGARLPAEAAKAEQTLYAALSDVEQTTRTNLLAWIRSLGPRAFEALVRMYLERENFRTLAVISAPRGYGRLVCEDPEAEQRGKTLVVVCPAKSEVEREMWEGEDERNQCESVTLFAAGELPSSLPPKVRAISGVEFAQWMLDNAVGVRRVQVEVCALDAAMIESIGGLDT